MAKHKVQSPPEVSLGPSAAYLLPGVMASAAALRLECENAQFELETIRASFPVRCRGRSGARDVALAEWNLKRFAEEDNLHPGMRRVANAARQLQERLLAYSDALACEEAQYPPE